MAEGLRVEGVKEVDGGLEDGAEGMMGEVVIGGVDVETFRAGVVGAVRMPEVRRVRGGRESYSGEG